MTFPVSHSQPWLIATVDVETETLDLAFYHHNGDGLAAEGHSSASAENDNSVSFLLPGSMECPSSSAGQVVDLRERHREVSEEPSHILPHCCQRKECWKIGISLPTSAPLLLVDADSSMLRAESTGVGLPCQSVQGTKWRFDLCQEMTLCLTARLPVIFCHRWLLADWLFIG